MEAIRQLQFWKYKRGVFYLKENLTQSKWHGCFLWINLILIAVSLLDDRSMVLFFFQVQNIWLD